MPRDRASMTPRPPSASASRRSAGAPRDRGRTEQRRRAPACRGQAAAFHGSLV